MSSRSGRWLRPLAIAAVLAVVAVGCGSSKSGNQASGSADTTPDLVKTPSGPPQTGGKLVFAVEAETDGWDPTQNRWAASGTEVAFAVFDPLVAFDSNLQAQPYLAESLTPNSDYTQWDIKLRSGVTFHDGTPLNSAALIKFLTAFKASALTGAAARPISDMQALDDLTVRLTMSQPWAAFPTNLSGQAGLIPAPAQLDSGDNATRVPIGTGPFKYKDWVPDKSFDAVKNTNYWRPGLPYLDEVSFVPIPEGQNRVDSVKTGDVNVTVTSAETQIASLLDAAKAGQVQAVRSVGQNDDNLVLINTTKAPMDDLRVRQAMAYAIDKTAWDNVTGADPSLNADSVFDQDSQWYADTGYPTYDPDKAKQLVQEVEAEKGPISFTFGTTPDPDTTKAAQLLATEWQAVGMDVSVAGTEQSQYILKAVTGDYQAQIWRQFGATDPDANYVWWIGSNATGDLALNMARNQDPQLDAALNTGRGSPDQSVRKQAYDTVQQRQTADLPYLWLSHLRWALGATNNVRGLDGGTLPDGTKSAGLLQGTMRVTEMWLEN